MTVARDEADVRREVRREATWVALSSSLLLAFLALASWHQSWELVSLPWWTWLVLAVPGLLLCLDLVIGAASVLTPARRKLAIVLLGLIVVGNAVGLVLLIYALVETRSSDIGGGQLLCTAVVIWLANIVAFTLCYWDVDDGGPFERATKERRTPDFQFPQDENPALAPERWRPAIWDYLYVSLTAASAFSPTDAMPLTHRAKLLIGIESTVSLAIVVLVTARAVNVLGS